MQFEYEIWEDFPRPKKNAKKQTKHAVGRARGNQILPSRLCDTPTRPDSKQCSKCTRQPASTLGTSAVNWSAWKRSLSGTTLVTSRRAPIHGDFSFMMCGGANNRQGLARSRSALEPQGSPSAKSRDSYALRCTAVSLFFAAAKKLDSERLRVAGPS